MLEDRLQLFQKVSNGVQVRVFIVKQCNDMEIIRIISYPITTADIDVRLAKRGHYRVQL